jgi:hypothetical protein
MNLYLSSDEYEDFKRVKEILQYQKIDIEHRSFMMAKIDIPLIGQKYGWGDKDIKTIYLTNRFEGDSIEKINRFPFYVHVLIPKVSDSFGISSFSDLISIAWACIYDRKEDAINYRIV